MLLILRNMLPDPSFGDDGFELAPGQPASPAMGDAPVTTRCSTATFEAGGAAACGLP
jgi:hypothetical protein